MKIFLTHSRNVCIQSELVKFNQHKDTLAHNYDVKIEICVNRIILFEYQ